MPAGCAVSLADFPAVVGPAPVEQLPEVTSEVAAPETPAEDPSVPSAVTDFADISLEQLLNIVIEGASGTEEQIFEAPATVSVLDFAAIQASGARSLPDLLRTVPGVQVLMSGPGNALISLRGMAGIEGNNVIVYLDKFVLNNPVDGTVDWGGVPVHLDQIESIEIVRGPVSPIHGANAYTGAILIKTKNPQNQDGFALSAGAEGGGDTSTSPRATAYASVGGRSGRWKGAFHAFGGHDNTGTVPGTERADGSRQPASRNAGLYGQAALSVTDQTTLSAEFAGSIGERGMADRFATLPEPRSHMKGLARLALNIAARDGRPSLSLWASGRGYSQTAEASSSVYPDGGKSAESLGGLLVRWQPIRRLRMAFEAEGGAVWVDAPFIKPEETRRAQGQFGTRLHGHIDITDELMLDLAGRIDINPFAPKGEPSGRVAIVYSKPSFSLRLAAGTAFRTPTYVEVAGRFVDPQSQLILLEGTGGLELPRITALELGATVALTKNLVLRPAVFVAEAADIIVGDLTRLTRKTYRNSLEPTDMVGGELEVELQATSSLRFSANGSFMRFLREPADPAATVGNSNYNSRLTGWAGARLTIISGLHAAAGFMYASARQFDTRVGIPPQLVSHRAEPITRVDGSLQWSVPAMQGLRLYARVLSHLQGDVESPFPVAAELPRLLTTLGLNYVY